MGLVVDDVKGWATGRSRDTLKRWNKPAPSFFLSFFLLSKQTPNCSFLTVPEYKYMYIYIYNMAGEEERGTY